MPRAAACACCGPRCCWPVAWPRCSGCARARRCWRSARRRSWRRRQRPAHGGAVLGRHQRAAAPGVSRTPASARSRSPCSPPRCSPSRAPSPPGRDAHARRRRELLYDRLRAGRGGAAACRAPRSHDPPTAGAQAVAAFAWPAQFEGRPLTALPLAGRDRRFADDFPGRVGRFSDGTPRDHHALHDAGDAPAAPGVGLPRRRSASPSSPCPRAAAPTAATWGCFAARKQGDGADGVRADPRRRRAAPGPTRRAGTGPPSRAAAPARGGARRSSSATAAGDPLDGCRPHLRCFRRGEAGAAGQHRRGRDTRARALPLPGGRTGAPHARVPDRSADSRRACCWCSAWSSRSRSGAREAVLGVLLIVALHPRVGLLRLLRDHGRRPVAGQARAVAARGQGGRLSDRVHRQRAAQPAARRRLPPVRLRHRPVRDGGATRASAASATASPARMVVVEERSRVARAADDHAAADGRRAGRASAAPAARRRGSARRWSCTSGAST